eukprot:TRINITY_DN20177_c0_g1_i1.p3 TRINITY_DN20177_c0_g1~~TRINITY_DN20177_c0_g1_i1.p3  ORF type:complete len:110 (+),score=8.03 TRINITY_DN20177_c0_g1_i1:44-373(+)
MDTCVWRLCDDEDELPLASAPERAAGWALEVAASLQLPESAAHVGLEAVVLGGRAGGYPGARRRRRRERWEPAADGRVRVGLVRREAAGLRREGPSASSPRVPAETSTT